MFTLYKEAEKHINNGLSLFPRILLGSAAALFGVVLTWFGIHGFMNNVQGWPAFIAIGLFCSLIALVSFTWGRVRQFIGSVIGVVIFILACWYLISQITDGPLLSGRRSEPSIVYAILFMIFFGIPGIKYTFSAKFGLEKNKNEP